MNMMNTMRRGLATTAMSLVCLMAGTMNTLAATDAGTELVSQIDAAAGEETNGTSTEAAQTPSGPASDPELIRKQTNAAAEEAADTNASEAEVAAFSNESAQVEAENADEAAMTENTDTNAAAEAQEAEAPAEIYAGRFTTTAYCSCRRCCRGGKNRTKSGTIPQAGHTISADLRVFPLGTKLRINGVSIPSKTAAAASAETSWTSSSIPTVRHCSMEREAPMSILSDNYIDFKQKRVLQIKNLSPARPFFIILILLNPSAPYDISFSGKFSK